MGPSETEGAWDGGWPQSTKDFESLVETYLERLVRYAFRQVGNIQDAEDVVQEVFVHTYVVRSKLRDISSVGPYLYRSVSNGCTDLLRKRNRSGVTNSRPLGAEVVDEANGLAKGVQATEELRRIEHLLSRLPDEQAEAIRLRVFDELPLSQISEVVGCSVNTVCSRLRYGFHKLRRLVGENGN